MQQFVYFTEEYDKVYNSSKERNYRSAIFHANLKQIKTLNRMDQFSSYGITKFSDLSGSEFATTYLMPSPMNNNAKSWSEIREGKFEKRSVAKYSDWTGPIPKCFDWRDRNPSVVTKVKNQGRCGSSWAFAAVSQIESIWALQGHNPLTELSTQQVISCNDDSNGCNGGEIDSAMRYVFQADGLHAESTYRYLSGQDNVTRSCSMPTSKTVLARISG